MRLLLFSDLHLDAAFAWLGVDRPAARQRRQALRDTLVRVAQLAADVKAEALLCGGDLYEHERVTIDTAAFLQNLFAELQPLPVYMAPGNHDWHGPESLYSRVAWTGNVHVYRESRLEPISLTDGLTLWGAAHRAPANTDGFLDNFRVDRGGVNLALFHGSERGWFNAQGERKQPHAPFDAEQIERAGLDHAFLGHYHVPREAPNHTYPGNPDPLEFGEQGLRGGVLATVKSDGSVEREWHRVAVTQAHDLAVDVSSCASQQDIRDEVQRACSGLAGIARITLIGELQPEIDLRPADLVALAPNLQALSVRAGALHIGYDLDGIGKEATVRGQFVRDVHDAELTQDERQRVLITGLRALDRRTDLEVV